MKNIRIILSFALIATMFVGCSEDFFDRTPTEYITQSDLGDPMKDPAVMESMVNGMYLTLFTSGTGGIDTHADFGQKSNDIISDLLCGDMGMAGSNYGHFYNSTELKSTSRTNNTNYAIWRYNFRLIKAANDILALYKDDQKAPTVGAEVWGQAKAVRAYAYYNLINFYSKGFKGFESVKVLPIYDITSNVAQPFSTAQQVYDFIKKDISDAVDALEGFDRSYYNEIDQSVAKGIRSYIYLMGGEWANAISDANDVIALNGLSTAKDVTSGFSKLNTKGILWGVDITNENTGKLASFWGHIDIYTYGYAYAGDAKIMDSNIFAAIDPLDVRAKQFDANGRPTGKFYNADRKKGADKSWEGDVFWLRVAEMYLVKAEAEFNSTGAAAAQLTINSLLNNRKLEDGNLDIVGTSPAVGTPAYTITSADDIYLQWRIECWGEGKSYAAMKRLHITNTRGANHSELAGVAISWDDDRLTFPTPENEAINNPNVN